MARRVKGRRDDLAVEELREAEAKLQRLLKCEEDFWRQRAKLFWLQSGELNMRAFHKFANYRKHKRIVTALQNDDGQRVDRGNELDDLIHNYLTNIF